MSGLLNKEGKALNSLMSSLAIGDDDRVVFVRENRGVDASFVVSHLLKRWLQNHQAACGVCFVPFHNTLGHYQIVGKKLGYDLSKEITKGRVKVVEPLLLIADDLDDNDRGDFLTRNGQDLIKQLYSIIKQKLDDLFDVDHVCLIVDDLSHLLDLGVDLKYVINMVSYFVNLCTSQRLSIVFGVHVAGKSDEIIANSVEYVSDVVVDVSALKTGRSSDVTGVVNVTRKSGDGDSTETFHYKAYDRGIRTFQPGESLQYLYK